MERIDRILRHPVYRECLAKVEEYEKDRIFCRHQTEHFLDVARIAWILNLEEEKTLQKDVVYAAALLHDIGRYVQYEDGTPHERASARIAPDILRDCGYSGEETERIVGAIAVHRNRELAKKEPLKDILYRADKASRACFACKAEGQCDWKADKKNRNILY